MTLIEKLKSHDWSYEYSEDAGTWAAGQVQRDAIRADVRTLPDMMLALAYYPRVPEPKQSEYRASIERAFIVNSMAEHRGLNAKLAEIQSRVDAALEDE